MAREIRATVKFVGEPGKAEINAFARAIVPLLKERAEEIVAMCNAPENRAAFEAYSAEMAYWRAKRAERHVYSGVGYGACVGDAGVFGTGRNYKGIH